MQQLEFEGIVTPKNDDIYFPLVKSGFSGKDNDTEGNIEISVINSQIRARVYLRKNTISLGNIKNAIEYLINALLDAYGYYHGAPYEAKLSKYIDNDNKIIYSVDPGADFLKNDTSSRPFKPKEVVELQNKCSNLIDVLSNFRKSLRYPEDRVFFSYRAIESIRQYFKEKNECNNRKSWELLRGCLNISEAYLRAIEKLQTIARHGLFSSLSDEDNKLTLERTIKIIDRFLLFVDKGSCLDIKTYPLLDV